MSNKPSEELNVYLAESIIDYIKEQTADKEISSDQIQKLQKAVSKICLAGYPDDKKTINAHVPKLVRASLDSSQLPWVEAARKIGDTINPSKNNIFADILNKITLLKDGKGLDNAVPELNQNVQALEGRSEHKASGKNNTQQIGLGK